MATESRERKKKEEKVWPSHFRWHDSEYRLEQNKLESLHIRCNSNSLTLKSERILKLLTSFTASCSNHSVVVPRRERCRQTIRGLKSYPIFPSWISLHFQIITFKNKVAGARLTRHCSSNHTTSTCQHVHESWRWKRIIHKFGANPSFRFRNAGTRLGN